MAGPDVRQPWSTSSAPTALPSSTIRSAGPCAPTVTTRRPSPSAGTT